MQSFGGDMPEDNGFSGDTHGERQIVVREIESIPKELALDRTQIRKIYEVSGFEKNRCYLLLPKLQLIQSIQLRGELDRWDVILGSVQPKNLDAFEQRAQCMTAGLNNKEIMKISPWNESKSWSPKFPKTVAVDCQITNHQYLVPVSGEQLWQNNKDGVLLKIRAPWKDSERALNANFVGEVSQANLAKHKNALGGFLCISLLMRLMFTQSIEINNAQSMDAGAPHFWI
ncbi:MAG: hypothetical protein KDC26_00825 [Armatimonadetes bacterium]|nr:hypothetical protein [Armatimonadota bacterium]